MLDPKHGKILKYSRKLVGEVIPKSFFFQRRFTKLYYEVKLQNPKMYK